MAHSNFTDDPLVQDQTEIKAVHVNELHTAINNWETAYGLANTPWTQVPAQNVDHNLWLDIQEMEDALDALRDTSECSGTFIWTATGQYNIEPITDITEVRAAVNYLEDNCCYACDTCDTYTCDTCDGACYTEQCNTCDYTCYGCDCYGTCYNYSCTCYGTCDRYDGKSCSCWQQSYGFRCSCNNACYGCNCNNGCYSSYVCDTCDGICNAESCTKCHGVAYRYPWT